ncbi:nuclease-related domain-containing protein [Streptomyces tropicalis]|uniref:NERD domain-containing protein n=1 Tax=Streptomyces tropicalis TaxID=3034234 RepID=A0ABT6A7V3_9ACTN|nr:NERD domain-containing protein [Streptomyces tropicalis]MDF3300724.1 NERD domain-containing protein [Streptomyces tropicalis]
MVELTVTHWTRYGHDRLYASLPDGRAAGWADCRTGWITILLREYRDAVTATLRHHLGTPPGTGTPPTATPRRPSAAVRPGPSGADRSGRAPVAADRRGEVSARADRLAGAPAAHPDDHASAPVSTSGPVSTPAGRPTSTSRSLTPSLPPLTPERDLARNAPGELLRTKLGEESAGRGHRILARLLNRPSPGDSWRTALVGERRAGAELNRLRRHGWRVLHSLPLSPRADLDHLLIGPGGVFTVTTEHHPRKQVRVGDDSVTVDHGAPQPYAGRSRAEAERVRRVLERHSGFPVPVEPVLVLVGVAELEVEATRRTVRVYRDREVAALAPLAGVLTAHQIDHLHTIARHRGTWTSA